MKQARVAGIAALVTVSAILLRRLLHGIAVAFRDYQSTHVLDQYVAWWVVSLVLLIGMIVWGVFVLRQKTSVVKYAIATLLAALPLLLAPGLLVFRDWVNAGISILGVIVVVALLVAVVSAFRVQTAGQHDSS